MLQQTSRPPQTPAHGNCPNRQQAHPHPHFCNEALDCYEFGERSSQLVCPLAVPAMALPFHLAHATLTLEYQYLRWSSEEIRKWREEVMFDPVWWVRQSSVHLGRCVRQARLSTTWLPPCTCSNCVQAIQIRKWREEVSSSFEALQSRFSPLLIINHDFN